MHSIRFVPTISILALAGCATSPKPAATVSPPTTPKGAPPRSDCPIGCVSASNSSGAICWSANLALPPEGCRLARCQQADCLFWECPGVTMVFPDPAFATAGNFDAGQSLAYETMRLITRDGATFKCRCATTPTGKVICKDCRYRFDIDSSYAE